MFLVRFSNFSQKKLKKLISKHRIEEKFFETWLIEFRSNPFLQKFKTHKVNLNDFGQCFSSRVDGDLRLIWDFDSQEKIRILVFDIGGHSGSKGVYK